MIDSSTASPPTLVVQHNALVNAHFHFSALEMRLFLLMLSQIKRADADLPVSRIAVRDLVPDSTSHSLYHEVRTTIQQLLTRTIILEKVGEGGQRFAQPELVGWPLLGQARYLPAQGLVEVVFNERLRAYLLELKGNFTRAQLQQLLQLKSPASHRIYWLLREHVDFGQRTIPVEKLRQLLGYTTEYTGRFDSFRKRVLDRAQQELAQTDLPFTYELIKKGRAIVSIHFRFAPTQRPTLAKWEAALLEVGLRPATLAVIRKQVATGMYDEGYIWFVLAQANASAHQGKLKTKAGAIYSNLTKGFLLPTYRQVASQPVSLSSAPKRSPAQLVRSHQRLANELSDAQTSLAFILDPKNSYSEEKRAMAQQEVQAKILRLTAQLEAAAK